MCHTGRMLSLKGALPHTSLPSLTHFVSSTFGLFLCLFAISPHASAMHSHLRSRDPNLMTPSRKAEDDPEYAKMHWARSQKEMLQADEVSMRLYSELDLLEAEKHPHGSRLSRGDGERRGQDSDE